MSISEIDRLHSQLSRLEGMFPGCRTEIVEGNIVISPVRPFHNETIMELWSQLKGGLGKDWAFVSDVAFPFSDEFEFCPDLALIPAPDKARNLTAYSPDLIELAVEVVSPSSVRNDYEVKVRQYAARGIPNYLILDPMRGHCVTLWNPAPEGYRGRDTVEYGEELIVDSTVGKLVIDTKPFPVDPNS